MKMNVSGAMRIYIDHRVKKDRRTRASEMKFSRWLPWSGAGRAAAGAQLRSSSRRSAGFPRFPIVEQAAGRRQFGQCKRRRPCNAHAYPLSSRRHHLAAKTTEFSNSTLISMRFQRHNTGKRH